MTECERKGNVPTPNERLYSESDVQFVGTSAGAFFRERPAKGVGFDKPKFMGVFAHLRP